MFSFQEHQVEIEKEVYVPRVEDKNSNMRMFKITTMDDLVPNSMNILEPSPVDDKGNQREDRKFLFFLSLFFFWNLPFMYVNCWVILIEINCSIDFCLLQLCLQQTQLTSSFYLVTEIQI